MTLSPLTKKEINILDYIIQYYSDNQTSPTFTEIKEHFQYASYNSVQRYLKQLEDKGYIAKPPANKKRGIRILKTYNPQVLENEKTTLPLLGDVAAGIPLEALRSQETIDIPNYLIANHKNIFALNVCGESMINLGILDGDIILVTPQQHAKSGDIAVVSVDEESTVKKIFFHRTKPKNFINRNISFPAVELKPANPNMDSQWFSSDKISIKGLVVGLFRKY